MGEGGGVERAYLKNQLAEMDYEHQLSQRRGGIAPTDRWGRRGGGESTIICLGEVLRVAIYYGTPPLHRPSDGEDCWNG